MAYFEPRISVDTEVFWKGCKEHKLLFQQCKCCKKVRWPAGYLCPDCLSEEMEFVELQPKGVIYSFVVMKKAFHPSLAEKVPYIVAEIDLEKDVRILANIYDCKVEDVRCGAPVEIVWEDCGIYSRPCARLKEG